MPPTLHYLLINCFFDENDLDMCKIFVFDLFSIVLFLIGLSFHPKLCSFIDSHMRVNHISPKGDAG